MPSTSHPNPTDVLTAARMTAFSAGQSPPPVSIPTRIRLGKLFLKNRHFKSYFIKLTHGGFINMRRSVLAIALIIILATTSMTALAQGQQKKAPEKAKDPVCGLIVDKDPNLSTNYKGETYYFCSKADMEKFKKEPEKYVKKK